MSSCVGVTRIFHAIYFAIYLQVCKMHNSINVYSYSWTTHFIAKSGVSLGFIEYVD